MTEAAIALLIGLFIGALAGAVVGYLIAAGREREARVRAETELAEATRNLQEQKELLQKARAQLSDTFKALSADALKDNREAFTQRAESLLKPLRETLKTYEEHVRALEKAREGAYAGLKEQLKALSQTHQRLEKETHSLSSALRNPQARGAWGEMALRRVVELAGMTNHVDFSEQVTSQSGARPDMVVQLPAGRQIIVDSKVPLDEYRRAAEADTEQERARHLKEYARRLREHMNGLARRSYWEQFEDAAEFVVMFIPGEPFLGGAVAHDPTLIEDGMRNRVVLATPTTLIALLRAVAYGWRQEQLAQNAQVVSDLGSELYERLRVFAEHLSDIGKNLGRATDAYNRAVGSLEARVFPSARRFEELGVSTGDQVPPVERIESTPRRLTPPESPEDEPQ